MVTDKNGLQAKTENAEMAMLEPRLHIMHEILQRMQLADAFLSHEGKRDYYKALGYPYEIDIDRLWGRYTRGHIAGTIVDVKPEHTWKNSPILKDGEWSPDDELSAEKGHQPGGTLFLEAWKHLAQTRRIFNYLLRLDKLSGLGEYGVLLIGVKGHSTLTAPLVNNAEPKLRPTGPDLAYLSVFSQKSAKIELYEEDPGHPRYQLPRRYSLAMHNRTLSVHHSRVIHVAENKLEDEVLALPRLFRVYNLLIDLDKMMGGGAEAAWQTINRGMQVDIRDGMDMTPDETEALKEEIDLFMNEYKRVLHTRGVDVNPLAGEFNSPTNLADFAISLIAATERIPKRLLLGSERGDLASTQDEGNWRSHIEGRQVSFAEPDILRPFVDRLIEAGILPKPKEGTYEVIWPSLKVESRQEEATTDKTQSEADKTRFEAYEVPRITRWREMGASDEEIARMLTDLESEQTFSLFDSPPNRELAR